MTDAHKIPQPAPLPPDLVDPEDLKSVPPEKLQPPEGAVEAPPPSLAQRAVLSLRAMADTDVRELMASRRGSKWRAVAVCLAFPAAIGLVLYVVGDEGNIKERARPMFKTVAANAEGIETKIARDAEELKKIKAELAGSAETPKDAKSVPKKPR